MGTHLELLLLFLHILLLVRFDWLWVLIDKEMEMGVYGLWVYGESGEMDWYEREGGEGLLVVSW